MLLSLLFISVLTYIERFSFRLALFHVAWVHCLVLLPVTTLWMVSARVCVYVCWSSNNNNHLQNRTWFMTKKFLSLRNSLTTYFTPSKHENSLSGKETNIYANVECVDSPTVNPMKCLRIYIDRSSHRENNNQNTQATLIKAYKPKT